MRFHFVLEGLESEQIEKLLSIESAMTGRSSIAVFNLKNLDALTSRGAEQTKAFLLSQLGVFLMEPIEVLLAATGLDLISLYYAVKGVPVVLTARRM